MMNSVRPFYFGLICLCVASLCTFLAFIIVYRYISFVRPLERFAIVVDAGSTKTSSNLYHVRVRLHSLEASDEQENGGVKNSSDFLLRPLNELIKVKGLSECKNGDPVANLKSIEEAKKLMSNCQNKFSSQIESLKFTNSLQDKSEPFNECVSDDISYSSNNSLLDALKDHRIKSVTKVYLGATAGLRSLYKTRRSEAMLIVDWLRAALNSSNEFVGADGMPKINQGFVDILSGFQEAAYSWLSFNFLCSKLDFRSDFLVNNKNNSKNSSIIDSNDSITQSKRPTIGTIELGGSSGQIAFQQSSTTQLAPSNKTQFETRNLTLFNVNYKLSARSDSCLGLTQSDLRANFVALRNELGSRNGKWSKELNGVFEVETPCLAKGGRMNFSSKSLLEMARLPCLLIPEETKLDPIVDFLSTDPFKELSLIGTGNVDRCNEIIGDILDHLKCKKQFALCLGSKLTEGPPKGIPFVTVSAYNKVIKFLALNKSKEVAPKKEKSTRGINIKQLSKLERTIEYKLGGHSVDFDELKQETNKFCSIPSNEIETKYPDILPEFRDGTCFRLHYITRLLTEYYGFSPHNNGTWNQLKFLIFKPMETSPLDETDNIPCKCNEAIDVGWTIGLLLNETNNEIEQTKLSLKANHSNDLNDIYFNHSSNWRFILRTLLLLMSACLLVVVGLVLTGFMVITQYRRQNYMDPSENRASYNQRGSIAGQRISPTLPFEIRYM